MDLVKKKPQLRGVSHLVAAVVALVFATALVASAPTDRATLVSVVYGIGLVGMYGVSAIYHRGKWSPTARELMRRLDHSAIFIMIAGTGTPLFVLGVGGVYGQALLAAVWGGALVGIMQSVLQSKRATWIVALPYVVVGWIGVAAVPGLFESLGLKGVALMLGGGVIYTVGAAIYAMRRPNPIPAVFGYHEVFHALVIIASVLHFVVIQDVVLAA